MDDLVKQRFWSRVNKTDTCWEWTGGLNSNGYGCFKIKNTTFYSHRISYELYYGKIQENLFVCHKCDNPKCINPSHLFLGTHSDNMRDMKEKNRQGRLIGNKNGGAKLTESQVLEIKKLYSESDLSQKAVGKKFNVCAQTVNNIVNNKKWKHIK